MLKMSEAMREAAKAYNYLSNAPHSLTRELIRAYPHSGCPDVAWKEFDWEPNSQGVQAWRAAELLNLGKDTFAPIRIYCPKACADTLDTTMLLDEARVDFGVSLRDLEQLSIGEFSRLIGLLLSWRRSCPDEDKARVKSDADEMRRIRIEHPDWTGTSVVLKALEIFPKPDSSGDVTIPHSSIPPEFQTVPISRSALGKLLGLSGNARAATAAIDSLARSGQITQMATENRQRFIYDQRQIDARLVAKNTTQHDATRRNTAR